MAGAATAATPAPLTERFKAAVVPLVAGTYGGMCTSDGNLVHGPGVPVVVDRLGRLSAGPRSDDIVHERTNLSLEVGRPTALVNFSAQVIGPNGEDANGYAVTYGNGTAKVTAMASGGRLQTSNACQAAGPVPAALHADLWRLALPFMHVADTHVACMDPLRGQDEPNGAVIFSDAVITIGSHTMQAVTPRKVEVVGSSDHPEGSLSYAVTDKAGNMAMLFFDADGRLHSAEWHQPDGSVLTCMPQSE